MRFRKYNVKQPGITLVEVMVAFAIMMVGVAALVKLNSYIVGTGSVSMEMSTAQTVARQKLEDLRNYDTLTTTPGQKAYADIVTGTQTVTQNGVSYALAWTVTNHSNPDYKTVDLTVSWTDRRGQAEQMRLTTNISKVDPALSGTAVGEPLQGSIEP